VMKSTADIYRRLRNTFRFLLGALEGFTPAERVSLKDTNSFPALEKYVLNKMAQAEDKIQDAIAKHDYGTMIQVLYNLCNDTLSSFYFDIRKDSLYCDRPDHMDRRACRTVLAELFDFLVTRLAPIIPFTTEEAWQYRAKGIFEDADSIHLRTFSALSVSYDAALDERWTDIIHVRNVVLAALEPARANKTIGSSLEAKPDVFVAGKYAAAVKGLDMGELCITSGATVIETAPPAGAVTLGQISDVGVVFKPAEGQKCQRCWKVLPEVGRDAEYPDLSPRDADAVRYYLAQRKAA